VPGNTETLASHSRVRSAASNTLRTRTLGLIPDSCIVEHTECYLWKKPIDPNISALRRSAKLWGEGSSDTQQTPNMDPAAPRKHSKGLQPHGHWISSEAQAVIPAILQPSRMALAEAPSAHLPQLPSHSGVMQPGSWSQRSGGRVKPMSIACRTGNHC